MKGIIAAPGMALAPAHIVTQPEIIVQKHVISDISEELERFRGAADICYSKIESIIEGMDGSVDPQTADILDFQLLLLEDTDFIGNMARIISGDSVNAEYAVKSASDEYISKLENMTDNDYLRERAADISDLSQRLVGALSGIDMEIAEPEDPYIAIGLDIAPSLIAGLDKSKLKGIVLEKGGVTSHCVILSRSLGIPCLIKTSGVLEKVKTGDIVLLDAVSGETVPYPDDAQIAAYDEYIAGKAEEEARLSTYASRASRSLDGAEMKVYANMTMSAEAESVVLQGGEGVGLFRSELLFMAHPNRPPSEESQYAEYSKAAAVLGSLPLIIRTLDVGGDKQISYLEIGEEDNPFLGYRAIRYCLGHPEIFMPQISAILRAGAVGNVWMMFPMISNMAELLEARCIVEQVKAGLKSGNLPFDPDMKIGMMIETPAAAADAVMFAKEADFFSIGTNDLSQYLFAADRANAMVTDLNSPFQPTLLRVIKTICDAAHEEGIEVDICGQAAEVETLLPVWLAMGVDNLSVSIPRITAVRRRICSLNKSDCIRLLDTILGFKTADEVILALEDFAERIIL